MAGDAYDVVIVGAGAGGGAMAWRLTERGLSVALVEAGPAYDPGTDYQLDRDDWEGTPFPAKVPTAGRQTMAPLPRLDPANADLASWNVVTGRYNASDHRADWGYQHAIGVGGSTLRFTGEAQRLHPDAMAMRSRFGVAADWPLTYAELEPYYVIAERIIGVAGQDGDTVRWRSAPYPLPPHEFSYASRKLEAGCRALGLDFVPNPRAALSRPYDGRPNCNYCGQCARGCQITDKGSADVTFVRKALATGRCSLLTDAQALSIEQGDDDRVTGVVVAKADGTQTRVAGRAVVLSAGAVETPRLLLASAGSRSPAGLANESGEVGRNFMETVFWVSSALHNEPLASHRGLPADGIV